MKSSEMQMGDLESKKELLFAAATDVNGSQEKNSFVLEGHYSVQDEAFDVSIATKEGDRAAAVVAAKDDFSASSAQSLSGQSSNASFLGLKMKQDKDDLSIPSSSQGLDSSKVSLSLKVAKAASSSIATLSLSLLSSLSLPADSSTAKKKGVSDAGQLEYMYGSSVHAFESIWNFLEENAAQLLSVIVDCFPSFFNLY